MTAGRSNVYLKQLAVTEMELMESEKKLTFTNTRGQGIRVQTVFWNTYIIFKSKKS